MVMLRRNRKADENDINADNDTDYISDGDIQYKSDKDIQYNSQDLDQEQTMNVKPVQLNSQTVHIDVRPSCEEAKITGIAILAKNRAFIAGACIYLFFGHSCRAPVYKTSSDKNGNFAIENIPPGYYTICARFEQLRYESPLIKVLPHKTEEHTVLLA